MLAPLNMVLNVKTISPLPEKGGGCQARSQLMIPRLEGRQSKKVNGLSMFQMIRKMY
jgi:hypothetical protein